MGGRPEAILYYFSGTGNSWRLAIAAAEASNTSAVAWSIERGPHPDHDLANHHGFFFPVYAFGLPPIMRRFLRSLPRGTGKSAFAAVAQGDLKPPPYWLPGYDGNALSQAVSLLKRKGYDRLGSAAANMPENWIVVGNTPSAATAAAIRAAGEEQVRQAWARHLGGESVSCKRFALWRLLLSPIYWSWLFLGRRVLGKCFDVGGECTGCGVCAGNCPVGAIVMERCRPRWRWNCENCMRCIGTCPHGAVQVSGFLLILYTVLSRPASILVARVPVVGGSVWLRQALGVAGWLLAVGLVDNILRLLLRRRGFRQLLARTHYTRRLRRYIAPGFLPSDPHPREQGAASPADEAGRP